LEYKEVILAESKVMVLGGDGFCGWPTSLHLADQGHEVVIVDNQVRREIDNELGVQSLTPIQSIEERLEAWTEVAGEGKAITYEPLDVAEDYEGLQELLEVHRPDAVVHFAQQRSAPYSMRSAKHKIYTVRNNVNATHNLLVAAIESGVEPHVIHLGTMGVYGYNFTGTAPIPEGYVEVTMKTPEGDIERRILHPSTPGSVYHTTKVLDQHMFQFYDRNDELQITDLHQGIVWGTQTPQTERDTRLINRFDYDGDFGTVLNRFLMQAAIGHPLTVHGTGGQTRAFIHIRDTVECIRLAIANPPEKGSEVSIFNQATEEHRLRDLASMIVELTGAEIAYVDNPRKEAAENELVVTHDRFAKLGLESTTLSVGLMEEIEDIAKKYADRADISKIPATSLWTPDRSSRQIK
jgi:UDP-sulfoquinovose synthase